MKQISRRILSVVTALLITINAFMPTTNYYADPVSEKPMVSEIFSDQIQVGIYEHDENGAIKKDAADNPIVATRPTIADIFYSEYLLDLSEAEKQALAAGDSYDLPLSEYFDFTEPYPTGTIADADVATDIDGTVGNWSVVKDNATGTFNLHVAFTKPLTGITNITSDIAFSANINRVQVSAPQDIKIFHPINNGVELFATRIFGNPSPLEVRSTKTAVDANNFTWTLDYNKGYDVIAANTATPIVEVADTNEVFTNITLYALQLDVDGNEIAQPTEL